jgi:hypothetical protein
MNTYSVTLNLTKDQFLNLIDAAAPLLAQATIKVIKEPADAIHAMHPKAKRASKLRGSKVNDTILTTIASGSATVKQLKEALEKAGMSAGSLSTGLAALSRSGQIERISDGVYGAKVREAAE